MEGLRAQADAAFMELDFARVPSEHELITVTCGESIQVNKVSMPISDIVLAAQAGAPPARSFRLAKINVRNNDPSRPWRCLNASKEEVLQLWRAFDLDPYQLYLFSRCVRGFQQLHIPGSRPDKQHYFANYDSHCLAWTYDVASATSNGVIVVRRRPAHEYGAFSQWFRLLSRYGDLVGHPLYPLLVSTAQILEFVYFKIEKVQAAIRAVESVSGFHPWHDRGRLLVGIDGDELDELSVASRNAGAVMIELEDILRQVKLSQRTGSAFDEPTPLENTTLQSLARDMEPAVYILSKQLDSAEDVIQYLRGRATTQLNVVSLL